MAVVEKREPGEGTEELGETEGARRATGGSPNAPVAGETEVVAKARRRRFTAEYKRRILREADRCTHPGEIGALLRREGLYSSHVTTWRAARDRGELAGLAPKPRGPKRRRPIRGTRRSRSRSARSRGGSSAPSGLRRWWSSKKSCGALGSPAREREVRLETVREVGPRLGVAPTCAALGVSAGTYYRRRKPKPAAPPPPTPARALAAPERAAVLEVLHAPRFVDLAPAQVYAHLLDEGRYLCSPRTMYRVLAASAEVRERRDQLRHPRYVAPELLATRPNELWSWDITKLLGPVKWTYFYLYVILDVFSRYVVGWMVAHRESARLAQKLIAETCARQGIAAGALTLHADRGSSMTSKPVALLLADLGVTKTHSRPHVSNDNPFSEAQFKTLKYRPEFPERFGSIEDARAHCRSFFPWYNAEHRHSGIGLLTAHDVHYGLADQRIAARAGVLTAAYAAHPERFVAGVPRPPARPTEVWINPPPATATSTSNPASAGSEKDGGAFRAPYSHAAASGRPDLRTEMQQLSITRLPAAIANEADEPATTEAALH